VGGRGGRGEEEAGKGRRLGWRCARAHGEAAFHTTVLPLWRDALCRSSRSRPCSMSRTLSSTGPKSDSPRRTPSSRLRSVCASPDLPPSRLPRFSHSRPRSLGTVRTCIRAQQFEHPAGDHFALLAVYEQVRLYGGSGVLSTEITAVSMLTTTPALLSPPTQWRDAGFSPQWCQDNFVQVRSVKKARDIRDQLAGMCERVELVITSNPDNIDGIRKVCSASSPSPSLPPSCCHDSRALLLTHVMCPHDAYRPSCRAFSTTLPPLRKAARRTEPSSIPMSAKTSSFGRF